MELPTAKVSIGKVVREDRPRFQALPGTVRPAERAVVSSKVLGTVETRSVALGRKVSAGETLATLSANEIAARVEQAKAALAQTERDLQRETRLLEQGASTTEAVRNLEDKLRISKAGVEEAETLLGYTTITAPFAGVITREYVKEGDLASPGTPLFDLEGAEGFQVEVRVPDSLAAPELGTEMPVDLGQTSTVGSVAEVSPSADAATRTRLAKLNIPSATGARSGQFARVSWPAGVAASITVSGEAVTAFGQMERVFVVEEGKARLRLVKTGRRTGDKIEILAGLTGGEMVVVGPDASLVDGQPVEESR